MTKMEKFWDSLTSFLKGSQTAEPAKSASLSPPQPSVKALQVPAQQPQAQVPNKVAVYNIEKHTFTLPNGTVYEAHSGLGHDQDNPAGVADKMRGSTPPNLYNVTFREGLFHGVQALRLTPIGEDPMYGRAGLLIHTYMLRGLPGQSNGCIVMPQYLKVLLAFRAGEFNQVRVVAH